MVGRIKMNVFADLHHGDLYYSLHLLFEKRLGWNLFRPIGLDWFKKGFWKIAEPYGNPPDTIGQYLEVPSVEKSAHWVQRYGETQLVDDVYYISTRISDGYYIQKAITLETFLKMDIDFVIATYDRHEEPYSRLISKYKPNTIPIFQMGNVGWTPKHIKNVLVALDISIPSGFNYIKYHPEHHGDYHYVPPTNHNIVKNFMNCMVDYPEDLAWFLKYEKLLPELTWKMHGIKGRDGVISNDLVPQAMRDSAFIWHVKSLGSCGFVPRQAMACGRPVITRTSYAEEYKTLARGIYEDSINCIDLDAGTEKENIEKIKYFMQPENHIRLCESTVEDFKRKVNFEEEARVIKIFLDSLKSGEKGVINFKEQ